jgi:alkyl sulfatase BDS1-like metallo-beta-lactamase superfamily hydrolase
MKPAHRATIEANARLQTELDFSDRRDFDDAQRGFIGTIPDAHIQADNGRVAWSMAEYGFIQDEAPSTANPSLWRLSQLNRIHGLFKVTDRIYQVRGFCLANVTFIESDTGLIVIDPLTFTEHARAALGLYFRHRGDRRVVAVIYTHCHRDHYGGVRGVISEEDARDGTIQVIGPVGFTEEAFSESILAGVAMRRRSLFQFGTSLDPGPMAHIDSGLGKAVGRGSDGFIAPTSLITQPVERRVIDGIEIVFQLTPETEAPAEMNLFFPGLRALDLAEKRLSHNAQSLPVARRQDTRRAGLGTLSGRGARLVCPVGRRRVRPTPLACVGRRPHRRIRQRPA